MDKESNEPIGYMKYKMTPKAGGTSALAELAVFSIDHAEKAMAMLSKEYENIICSDFKLVGPDRTTPLEDKLKIKSPISVKKSRVRSTPSGKINRRNK